MKERKISFKKKSNRNFGIPKIRFSLGGVEVSPPFFLTFVSTGFRDTAFTYKKTKIIYLSLFLNY